MDSRDTGPPPFQDRASLHRRNRNRLIGASLFALFAALLIWAGSMSRTHNIPLEQGMVEGAAFGMIFFGPIVYLIAQIVAHKIWPG